MNPISRYVDKVSAPVTNKCIVLSNVETFVEVVAELTKKGHGFNAEQVDDKFVIIMLDSF